MELADIRGIGPARIKKLNAVGIFSLRDLLLCFPVRYEDHTTVVPCSTASEEPVLVLGTFIRNPVLQRFHGLTKVSCQIRDDSGALSVQWFNSPWIMKTDGSSIRTVAGLCRIPGL